MANEKTISISGTLVNGSLSRRFNPGSLQFDQSVLGATGNVVIVSSTAAETISFGDITNVDYCFLRNLDPTNYVDIGAGIGGSSTGGIEEMMRLEAGEVACFPLKPTGMVMMALANTAPVKLQVEIWEE